jgi:hypothetical protein
LNNRWIREGPRTLVSAVEIVANAAMYRLAYDPTALRAFGFA